MSTSNIVVPPLSQGGEYLAGLTTINVDSSYKLIVLAGYGVVLGVGALFAVVMMLISHSLFKTGQINDDNEEFSVRYNEQMSSGHC